jgi:hypothetical protein
METSFNSLQAVKNVMLIRHKPGAAALSLMDDGNGSGLNMTRPWEWDYEVDADDEPLRGPVLNVRTDFIKISIFIQTDKMSYLYL